MNRIGIMGIVLFAGFFSNGLRGQTIEDGKAIIDLVGMYADARDRVDTVLLASILTDDVDQLVSTGEWRYGKAAAIKGMGGSSRANPGDRVLKVERVRYLDEKCALADARYVINGENGTERKMWSTFIAVKVKGNWKISGIRNMLPAGN
ncbi:conserved hypothetical protein [Cyclobacterium xiamenense]|uniref:DUF4440 domain-containing protein n=1 Tax=Cyclobacterium xiamenense TaxID=1297121 RepID=A0A1H6U4I0_9BACT|nr:DUF4440 domain-containing protein [Cyclobacterium xiamenense]SEI87201.1 conserved hypothetical protein [Cyclobacterium xiamenense]